MIHKHGLTFSSGLSSNIFLENIFFNKWQTTISIEFQNLFYLFDTTDLVSSCAWWSSSNSKAEFALPGGWNNK